MTVNDSCIVEYLDSLIQTCRDGELGFGRCAGQAQSLALQWLLTQRAQRWRKAGAELRALRDEYAGAALQRGGDDARCGWAAAPSALAGLSDAALLAECERGEDAAQQRYRQVLDEDLPIVMRAVAQRHCDATRDHRAELRGLRATLQAAPQRQDCAAAPHLDAEAA